MSEVDMDGRKKYESDGLTAMTRNLARHGYVYCGMVGQQCRLYVRSVDGGKYYTMVIDTAGHTVRRYVTYTTQETQR